MCHLRRHVSAVLPLQTIAVHNKHVLKRLWPLVYLPSRSSAHSSGWKTHTLRPCDCASRSTPTHRTPICRPTTANPCPVLPHHTFSSALPTAANALSPPRTPLSARNSTKTRAVRAHSHTARRQTARPPRHDRTNRAAVAAHPPHRSKMPPQKAVRRQAAS